MPILQPLLYDNQNAEAKVGVPEYAFINMHEHDPHGMAHAQLASSNQHCVWTEVAMSTVCGLTLP